MSVRAVREGLSQHYEEKWQHHDGYWLDHYPVSQRVYASHIERRNAAILAAIPNGLDAVLDVGCGVGDLMRLLAGKSRRVVGVDIAPVNVRQARRNLLRSGVENSVLIQSGAETLPFRDGSFDAVILADVIEHIPDVAGAVREARRVLRAGGRFICVTPHAQTLRLISTVDRAIQSVVLFLFRRRRTRSEDARVYERFLTKAEMELAVRTAGFHVEMYRRVSFYPGREGGGTFGVVLHVAHKVLKDRWFSAGSTALIAAFSLVERLQIFNQKQMWVARA